MTEKDRIVWVDMEMSGLDPQNDHILEMACLITDADLNLVAEGPELVIHQSDEILENMSDWCKEHHGESGLTEAVKNSTISLEKAEQRMLMFVQEHTPAKRCPLAGNSIQGDHSFLRVHVRKFFDHLHYRIVDVSTVKELCRRWYPAAYQNAPSKKRTHRALDDIKESLEELRYYRKTIFQPA